MEIEKLKNIINMLSSTDKENHVVALTLLESIEHNKNCFVQLLMAYKLGKPKTETWLEHAPTAYKYISNNAPTKDSGITFNEIFQSLLRNKFPVEQIQIFLEMFSEYLKNQCHSLGYHFIDSIEMNIKLKEIENVNPI